jgi:glycosyltransferase 2 family protein
MKNNILKFLLFLCIGVGLLWYIYYVQNEKFIQDCNTQILEKSGTENSCSLFNKLKTDFAQLNYIYILFAILLFTLSNYIRALRWKMMINSIDIFPSIKQTFAAVCSSYMINLALPRGGEFAKASFISKGTNKGFDQIFGTVVAERIVDTIIFGIIAILALLFAYSDLVLFFSERFQMKLYSFTGLLLPSIIILIVLFICLFILGKRHIAKLKSMIFIQKIIQFKDGLIEGLKSVLRIKNYNYFILYSVIIWTLYFVMIVMAFKSYEATQHLGLRESLVVYFFGSLGFIFPSPGGMGSYHFLTMASLNLYGIANTEGFVFANIVFFILQIATNVFLGLVTLPWLTNLKEGHK